MSSTQNVGSAPMMLRSMAQRKRKTRLSGHGFAKPRGGLDLDEGGSKPWTQQKKTIQANIQKLDQRSQNMMNAWSQNVSDFPKNLTCSYDPWIFAKVSGVNSKENTSLSQPPCGLCRIETRPGLEPRLFGEISSSENGATPIAGWLIWLISWQILEKWDDFGEALF